MQTRVIPGTDLIVSRIAYGCASLGGRREEPLSADVIARAERLISTACDSGITLFDLADIYGGGKSEAVFGELLKRSPGLRDKIVIQSKCGIRFQDDPQPGDPYRMDFSRAHIVSCVVGSLRRLGTDHLDILLLHMPDALADPEELASAFDELQGSGKVRHFGVSNHTPGQIELLKKFVRQPLVVNQVHLGLAHSYLIAEGIEANRDETSRITQGYAGSSATLDYCRLHDIQIQAYAPLRGANIGLRPDLLNPPADAAPELKHAAQVLADLAKKNDVMPSAISLAWLLRHPAGILPVIGTTNPEHVIENCAAVHVTLSREEWYTLFAAAAGVPSLRLIGLLLPTRNS